MRDSISRRALFPALLGNRQEPALALVNGRIWTGDGRTPWSRAMLVRGGRVAALGDNATIRSQAKGGRILDLRDAFVCPGFIDSHVHFLTGGHRLAGVQLRDAKSPEEFTRRIAAFAQNKPKGAWIRGGDWDHELWPNAPLPHRKWIDSVTPDHPVWVNRLDGHMALANSAALRLAGVTKSTVNIAGGEIVRDPNGEPTGLLKDNAMSLVDRVEPPYSEREDDDALQAAMRYVAEQGVTSVHHVGTWQDLAVFERNRARLKTRIYSAVPLSTHERLAARIRERGRGDEWLRIGMLKGFADGSLGSHTAAFLEPYTDQPSDRGLLVNKEEDLLRWTQAGVRAGLQVCIHAIGDRANRIVLDIYEKVARTKSSRDPRWRIEHAQHLSPVDIPRFARLGVIASMQPYHAIDDGRWAERVIGKERCRGTYAFRSLLAAQARLAFGSDWYVAPPTPLEGIYAAVTRSTLDGRNPSGWHPEQKISAEDALTAYTSNGAFASFEEKVKGVLTPGLLADFVVLDRDPTKVPSSEIRFIKILATCANGAFLIDRLR
jgi:hypothetical protein